MHRRTVLGLAGDAVTSLAGCLGGDSGGGGSDRSDHPATQGLDAQPSLGPDPADAENLLVAFEDPSCPTCRRFETGTFPTIRSELVDSGDAAFDFVRQFQPLSRRATLPRTTATATTQTMGPSQSGDRKSKRLPRTTCAKTCLSNGVRQRRERTT